MEDLYKLHNEKGDGYLDIFKRAKVRRMLQGSQSNLNKYKSIAELGQFVSTSLDVDDVLGRTKGEISNDVHAAKDDIKVLYEDDDWLVLIPLSHEASCYWAKGAHWCTAYRDDDGYYRYYSKQGPLYMNINKYDEQESTQFHIESEQFMDYYDSPIDQPIFNHIVDGEGLLDFYKNYLSKEQFMILNGAEALGKNLYALIRYEDESDRYETFMIDSDFNELAGPYDRIYRYFNESDYTLASDYNDKITILDINGNKYDLGYINTINHFNDNIFVFETANNRISIFNDGKITNTDFREYSKIELQNKRSYLVLIKNNKKMLYNSEFKPILKNSVDVILYRVHHNNGNVMEFFIIVDNDKFNVIDLNGNYLFSKFYDYIESVPFRDMPSSFIVRDGAKANILDVNGKSLLGIDVDDIKKYFKGDIKDCYYFVKTSSGEILFIDKDCNLVTSDGKIKVKSNLK